MCDMDTYIADYRTDEGLRIRTDNVSPCLNSVKASETEPSWMPPLAIEETRIRRLTPNECERLQGFSARNEDGTWEDGWTGKGMVDGKVVDISDTQRYKMCGNAVTVNVVRAIAAKMLSTVETDCEHKNLEQGEDRYGREEHEYTTYWFCSDCGEEIE